MATFGQMVGKSIRGAARQVGAAANGFSNELGLHAPGGSIGENAGKYAAKAVAAPFRFMKDVASGLSSSEESAVPESHVPERHQHVSYSE